MELIAVDIIKIGPLDQLNVFKKEITIIRILNAIIRRGLKIF